MTDPLTKIDKLAQAARWDKPPAPDVSSRVLAAIRPREAAYGYAPLQWIAVGSTVAATAMGVSLLWLYETWSAPFNALFLGIFWGLI